MIAALILVLSVSALVRFGVAQWRSIWRSIADQPLSGSLESVSGIASDAIGPEDFELLAAICAKSCQLPRQSEIWLKEVGIYYRFLRIVRKVGAKTSPLIAEWTDNELTVCSRYAGAVLDHNLNANFAYAFLNCPK